MTTLIVYYDVIGDLLNNEKLHTRTLYLFNIIKIAIFNLGKRFKFLVNESFGTNCLVRIWRRPFDPKTIKKTVSKCSLHNLISKLNSFY